MAAPTHRVVTLSRDPAGVFTARNVRGGTLTVGDVTGDTFTPTELLLAAIGACTAIDVATLTSRRAEPDLFEVQVDAEKVRDDGGNRLQDLAVTFRVTFPDGTGGDAARELLPEAVRRSHDRLCTVSRTVELPTPVTVSIDPEPTG
jgi:putative redox protein